MKCPSCGTEGLPNRKFCGVCGHAFPSQSADFSTPPSSGGYSPPPSNPSYPPPVPPSPYGGASSGGMGGNPYGASYGATPPIEQRYKALRVIAVIYKVLAFLAAAIYALIGLMTLVSGATASRSFGGPVLAGGFLGAIIMFLAGALVFVFFYGMAEFIILFINIEENTRTTNELLQKRNN